MNSTPGRDRLVALISRIQNAEGTEGELDRLMLELKEISLMPNVSDLIFYPGRDMSAEEIADLILQHKPGYLPNKLAG